MNNISVKIAFDDEETVSKVEKFLATNSPNTVRKAVDENIRNFKDYPKVNDDIVSALDDIFNGFECTKMEFVGNIKGKFVYRFSSNSEIVGKLVSWWMRDNLKFDISYHNTKLTTR